MNLARNDLPESCPPSEAENLPQEFCRLGYAPESEIGNFVDWVDEPQNRDKSTSNECRSKSMSVFRFSEKTIKRLLKLPRIRSKYSELLFLVIPSEAGHVSQTGNDISHYSWWRSATAAPEEYVIRKEDLDVYKS